MAIWIDYLTKVINVPKTDTVLIQSIPSEIRELDLNWFRLQLKDLEDDEQGIPYIDTHSHNTTVDVGGVTLARVIEIINGYTVTFEDGQYAVNLIGANSNVGDVVNVNQVSVRSSNSAGLVTSAAIEYGEYGGGVTIDVIRGESGTIYPIGTPRRPVNNLADAVTILESRGFPRVYVVGDLTINSEDFSAGVIFEGLSKINSNVILNINTNVNNCTFTNMGITGVLDNGNRLEECLIGEVLSFDGFIENCGVNVGIVMGGFSQTTIIDSYSNVAGGSTPYISVGSGSALAIRNWVGGIEIQDKTSNDECSIDIASGQVKVAPSCTDTTDGGIIIRGIGKLTNNAPYPNLVNHNDYIQASVLQSGIERASYIGKNGSGATLDVINGTNSTDWPYGTRESACLTETNAHTISETRGFYNIYVVNSLNLSLDYSDGHTFWGDNPQTVNINVLSGANVSNCQFRDCYITGELDTFNIIRESIVGSITNANGFIYQCALLGPIVVSDNISIQDAWMAPTAPSKTVIIDFNGLAKTVIISSWSAGKVLVRNMVTGSYFSMSGTGGKLLLDSNNTGGIIAHAGAIDLDTTNEELFDMVSDVSTAGQVWDMRLSDHTSADSTGEKLDAIATSGTVTPTDIESIVNGVWDEDLTTHTNVDSAGKQLGDIDTSPIPTIPTVAQIADAVWEEILTDHSGTVGSVSEKLNSLNNDTSPADITAIADEVWTRDLTLYNTLGTAGNVLRETGHIRKAVFVNTEAGVNGDGTAGSPFNNIGDAKDHAEEMGIKEIVTYSEITLNTNFKNFIIYGLAAPVVDTNGQDCSGTEFHHCTMRGTYTGNKPIVVQESVLDDGFQLSGFFENCTLAGTVTVVGSALVKNCASGIAGVSTPIINMNTGVASSLSVRDYSGGLLVQNMDHVNDVTTIEMSQGRLFLDNTNTLGLASIRGLTFFDDTSAGTTVETSGMLDPSKTMLLPDEEQQLFDALTEKRFVGLSD